MSNFNRPAAQQQCCIAKRVQKSGANSFFNLLTSPEILDMVEAQLPEHRESKDPPTLALSMFSGQIMSSDSSCQNAVTTEVWGQVANYALGGKRFSAFDGSAGTFFCRSIIVPEENFAITIMMNAGSGSGTMKVMDWLTMQIIKKHFNWWWKFWL